MRTTMRKPTGLATLVLAVHWLAAGCEPTSITEAEDQLGRNRGTVSFLLPIADTTYLVSELLESGATITTLPSGVLGVEVQADSFSAFSFPDQLVTSEVTTSVAFPAPGPGLGAPGDNRDTVAFATPQGSDVVSATVGSGFVVRTITNNTGCSGTVGATLSDTLGTTFLTFPQVNVNNGQTVTDSVNVAGVNVAGVVDIETMVTFAGACVPIPTGQVSSAMTIRPLTLSSVTLDNVNETIAVEQARELLSDQLDLRNLEDAIRASELNEAVFNLDVINTADVPLNLANFFVVAVRLDGAGQLMRDGGGNLIFETDSLGARLEAQIADPGMATLSVPRQGTTTVSVDAAALISHMVNQLIDDVRIAFVALGDATAGDGTQSTITSLDDVQVRYTSQVGLDFTIPLGGVSITRNQQADGFDIDSADADELAERLISAAVSAAVVNSTPFELQIDIALVPGVVLEPQDVFTQPGAILLQSVSIPAAPTDANGLPTGSASDSVSLSIAGTDSRVLFEPTYTAGIRFTLVPRAGGGRRGAILPTAGVDVDAAAVVELRQGATGGGS